MSKAFTKEPEGGDVYDDALTLEDFAPGTVTDPIDLPAC